MTENKSDEISLKDIISGILDWKNFLLSKWKLILVFGILGASYGFYKGLTNKPVYTAKLTFAMEEKSSGGFGAYAGIASQFGIDVGGSAGGVFTGENILELMRSRLLIEKTLLSTTTIENKKMLLIDRYIEFNDLRKEWAKNPSLANLTFHEGDKPSQNSFQQDSILRTIYVSIKDGDLEVGKVDKKLNIVFVKYQSKDQIFAKEFTQRLVENVSQYYIETKTKKSRTNVSILQNRTDSVKRALDSEMYGAALTQDRNQNILRAQGRVSSVQKQMNVKMLSTLYEELVKNLELSKLSLMRDEPLIQIIDSPRLPLESQKTGKIKGLIIGGFLSTFIIVLILVLNRIYKKIIA